MAQTNQAQTNPAPSAAEMALTAADRLEIKALLSEYSFHEDSGNAEAWSALFTEDGNFYGQNKPSVHGRPALLESARRRWNERPEARGRVHWVCNILIWPTPEGAAAKSYQMTVKEIDGTIEITALSGKEDELRKENGKWRFHVRRVVPLGAK